MYRRVLSAALFLLIITSCTSLKLSPANFAWPVESVLQIDESGTVAIDRYSTEFNPANLFKQEFPNSTDFSGKELRVIRGADGFYYMTAAGFQNIYLFSVEKNAFVLSKKIKVTESGLSSPAFNQRKPFIELIDGENSYLIDSNGIKE